MSIAQRFGAGLRRVYVPLTEGRCRPARQPAGEAFYTHRGCTLQHRSEAAAGRCRVGRAPASAPWRCMFCWSRVQGSSCACSASWSQSMAAHRRMAAMSDVHPHPAVNRDLKRALACSGMTFAEFEEEALDGVFRHPSSRQIWEQFRPHLQPLWLSSAPPPRAEHPARPRPADTATRERARDPRQRHLRLCQ